MVRFYSDFSLTIGKLLVIMIQILPHTRYGGRHICVQKQVYRIQGEIGNE